MSSEKLKTQIYVVFFFVSIIMHYTVSYTPQNLHYLISAEKCVICVKQKPKREKKKKRKWMHRRLQFIFGGMECFAFLLLLLCCTMCVSPISFTTEIRSSFLFFFFCFFHNTETEIGFLWRVVNSRHQHTKSCKYVVLILFRSSRCFVPGYIFYIYFSIFVLFYNR